MVSRASPETSVNRRPSSIRNEMSQEPVVEAYVKPGEMRIWSFPGRSMFCCTAWIIIINLMVLCYWCRWAGGSSTEQSPTAERSPDVCGYTFRSSFFHSVRLPFPRRPASLLQSAAAYGNVSAAFDSPRYTVAPVWVRRC